MKSGEKRWALQFKKRLRNGDAVFVANDHNKVMLFDTKREAESWCTYDEEVIRVCITVHRL